MSNSSVLNLNIAQPALERLKNQVIEARKTSKTSKSSLYRRNFTNFLNSYEGVDNNFFKIANDYIRKLRREAINFDYDLPQRLFSGKETVDIEGKEKPLILSKRGQRNLLEILASHKLLFDYKQNFLIGRQHREAFKDYLKDLTEQELIGQLKHLKFSTGLEHLAKMIIDIHEGNVPLVKEVLEAAYGEEVNGLNEAIELKEQGYEITSYGVKQNLQKLLVEVMKLDSGTGFEEVENKYRQADNNSRRDHVADLIEEKFDEDAVEFFQKYAMPVLDINSPSQDLGRKLHAMERYAKLANRNKESNLLNILTASQNMQVIYKALDLLAVDDAFNEEALINKIADEVSGDNSSKILFALMRMKGSQLDNYLKKLDSNTQQFMEALIRKIPNLKTHFEDIAFDYRNLELQNSDSESATSSEGFMANLVDWFKEKFPIYKLVETMFNDGSNQAARDNAVDFVQLMPDDKMINFHKPSSYSTREATAAKKLQAALGL